jgi:hypothetical protein
MTRQDVTRRDGPTGSDTMEEEMEPRERDRWMVVGACYGSSGSE